MITRITIKRKAVIPSEEKRLPNRASRTKSSRRHGHRMSGLPAHGTRTRAGIAARKTCAPPPRSWRSSAGDGPVPPVLIRVD